MMVQIRAEWVGNGKKKKHLPSTSSLEVLNENTKPTTTIAATATTAAAALIKYKRTKNL